MASRRCTLTAFSAISSTNITVTVSNGEVTLDGTVSGRDDKRRAEDLADNVSGVRHVQNNLRIQQQGTAMETTGVGATRSSAGTTRTTR